MNQLHSNDTQPMEALQKDERMWATFCHLAGLGLFIFPFGNIIGPLIIWLLKRDTSPFVDTHGKEAVNFQISATIYLFVAAVLIFLLIGFLLLIGLVVLWLVCVIVATINANEGKKFRYPLNLRLIP